MFSGRWVKKWTEHLTVPLYKVTRVPLNWTNGSVCVQENKAFSLSHPHHCSPASLPSPTTAQRPVKTLKCFLCPRVCASSPNLSLQLRPREAVTFPVTLGCLQPIGRRQIYFSLSRPIAWQRGSAHCLVTVTNMLIREAPMMDGSSAESSESF